MKKYIVKALTWALGLFDDKAKQIESWPFPVEQEKKRPQVKKATTRTKKPAVVAKTARTKKVK